MKHKICLLIAVFAVVTCCGCSVGADQNDRPKDNKDNITENSTTVETTAPSESAASSGDDISSVVFMNSETSVKEKRLENDFIRIWCKSYTRWDLCTVVENLDGSSRQEFDEEEFAGRELWLTNDWFYYVDSDFDQDTVCRVPISYKKKKAKIHINKREKLFVGRDFDGISILIADSYMIYTDYDLKKNKETYYRYDFETKEVSELFDIPDDTQIVENAENGLPMIFQNSFFITSTKGDDRSVYSVSLDTLEKRVIQSDDTEINSDEEYYGYYLPSGEMTECNGAVYFAPGGSQVMRYEGKAEAPNCVLEEQSLQQIMESWNLWDEKTSHLRGKITHIYACNNRLYLILFTEWDQKEKVRDGAGKGKRIKRIYGRHILMSADFSDLDQWKLEKPFTKYVWKHAKNNKVYSEEDHTYYCIADCTIRRMGGGEILFWLDSVSEEEGTVKTEKTVLYDLAAGKIQTLDDDKNNYLCWDIRPAY